MRILSLFELIKRFWADLCRNSFGVAELTRQLRPYPLCPGRAAYPTHGGVGEGTSEFVAQHKGRDSKRHQPLVCLIPVHFASCFHRPYLYNFLLGVQPFVMKSQGFRKPVAAELDILSEAKNGKVTPLICKSRQGSAVGCLFDNA
jgi:hypothetical protein